MQYNESQTPTTAAAEVKEPATAYATAIPAIPAVRAMRTFQRGMEGEWEKAGICSDGDVMALVKETRGEIERR